MSLDALHPFSGQHAIQSAALAIDFASELELGEVSKLRAASASLFPDFPIVQDQQRTTFSVAFGPGSSAPTTQNDAGGFMMQRPSSLASSPPLRQIVVSRENLVLAVNDYTRWDRFKSDFDKYLGQLLGKIDVEKAIKSVALQFTDVFIWRADPSELDLKEVFNVGSAYLPPNVLSPNSLLWHSHHGYLKNTDAPIPCQQVDNINVSRSIVSDRHQLQILTSHKATFSEPLYKAWSSHKGVLMKIWEQMHADNKSILASLLTPEVQGKISLNKGKK